MPAQTLIMGSSYEDIIGSDIFTFVIGSNGKEYKVHSGAISNLSKPLSVLVNGGMREAKEKCVKWPDVDEKTFVRFTQWAYTKTYVTEEPGILPEPCLIRAPIFPTVTQAPTKGKESEKPLYSLVTANSVQSQKEERCRNQCCPACRTKYSTKICSLCRSAFTDCGACVATTVNTTPSKRRELIKKFLDESGIIYPTSTSVFSPRKNTEGCEDYTAVFLCHAKLYVVADTYDIPSLKQLCLHRLHATLKQFTLYPSRFNDIATLAKYVFENTVPEDKIRDMITLYYACIFEDARKQDGLKSLIEEIPDFAFGLIDKMSDRLA